MLTKVIKLGAEWCGPCKALEPIFHNVEKLEEFKNIKFESLDIDDEETEEMVEKYQIRNVPTILIFNENNELIDRMIGALPQIQIVEFLEKNLNK